MKFVLGMISIRGKCGYVWVLLATATFLNLSDASNAGAAVGVPDREADPIVLTGAQTPALVGAAPKDVVAFRWDGAWKQVPVQVDERKIVDYRIIRQWPMTQAFFAGEVYADDGTFAGADGEVQPTSSPTIGPDPAHPVDPGDPNLDQDDEIALMARDAGSSAGGKPDPSGVEKATRTPIRIKDPLSPQSLRFIYLFKASSALKPDAGSDYVEYDFKPDSGDYKTTYEFNGIAGGDGGSGTPGNPGPLANPESSSLKTAVFSQTFPGRWMIDGLNISSGTPAGVDILDGDKATVGFAGCERNELTFSRGGGGFIANIDGPVRAIRSFIGANSGRYTQRDLIYYEQRLDNNTYLRVHEGIGNLVTAMDYSEQAKGMTYRNSLNPLGVTIDGEPDPGVVPGKFSWEQVTGSQGSLVNVARLDTDISPLISDSSYFVDDVTPPDNRSAIICSGDDLAFGASGPWVDTGGPNTDPTLATPAIPAKRVSATRSTFYGPSNQTANDAILRSQQVDSPLVISTGAGADPTDPVPDPDPVKPGTPGRTNWVGLKVSAKPKRIKVKAGVTRTFRVTVRNVGDLPGKRLKVCPVARKKLVRTGNCRKLKKLKPGKARRFRFKATPRRAVGRAVRLTFRAKASQSKARSATVVLTIPSGR